MIDYNKIIKAVESSVLVKWIEESRELIDYKLAPTTHGDLPGWIELYNKFPLIETLDVNFNGFDIPVGKPEDINGTTRAQLIDLLMGVTPWKKGPYNLFGIKIDSEWRSDMKWERIKDKIRPITNRSVLDVGCGNGYHLWRMAAEKPRSVIGIDPSLKSFFQFMIMNKYINSDNVFLLPLGIEDMPENLQGFNTVFSMGVLYHRKSPIEHLQNLKTLLCENGELVLETLVVEGEEGYSLLPRDRYAMMRNVWFIPSVATLKLWMERVGYRDVKVIDVNQTSLEEQRATEWSRGVSLKDFLDPNDINKTVEGYPAPLRATITAIK